MAKEKKERFIVEFPLITEKYQEDILAKRMELGRRIYNQLVKKTRAIHREMTKPAAYKVLEEELNVLIAERKATEELLNKDKPAGSKKKTVPRTPREKELMEWRNGLRKEAGLTDFGLQTMALRQSKPYIKHLDSGVAQQIGGRLWSAWSAYFFRDGLFVHYCKKGNFNSLEGKSNKSGLKLRFGHESKHWVGKKDAIVWNGLEIPVKINYDKPYEAMAVQHDIAYNRIVRKTVHGKDRYYLQVVFKGKPPLKIDEKTGELKHPLGKGAVGVNVGAKYIAVASENGELFQELADKIDSIKAETARIDRAMERSRRAMNPDNYNEDGTAKSGRLCSPWVDSKRYTRLSIQKRDLERKQAALRKQQHFILANNLLGMGDTFVVAKRNYKGMQERKKETEKDEKGRYKSKKRYGKTIADKAPAMLIEMLSAKVEQRGGEFIKAPAKDEEKKDDIADKDYKMQVAYSLIGK